MQTHKVFFTKINPIFSETLGYSATELLQRSFFDFIHPEDRQATVAVIEQQLIQQGKTVLDFENRYLCKNRAIRWLCWRAVFNAEDGLIYAVAHDVTEHKQHEEEIQRLSASELNKAKLEAEKANRAKSDFLSSMSHELRTPLNAVLGFAQLLEDDHLNSDQQDNVQEILGAGRHLLDLINDVLDLSKIEAEKIDLNLQDFDLNMMMKNCLSLIQPILAKYDIQFIDQISGGQRFVIRADLLRFKQVLLNLISNAVKYNRVGGSVILSCNPIGDKTLRINVTDTGMGLSEAQLAKLFQPFERLSAKNSAIEGTGIGLCISKKLIEAMQGTIGVSSTPRQGSCFWIEIPRA